MVGNTRVYRSVKVTGGDLEAVVQTMVMEERLPSLQVRLVAGASLQVL